MPEVPKYLPEANLGTLPETPKCFTAFLPKALFNVSLLDGR